MLRDSASCNIFFIVAPSQEKVCVGQQLIFVAVVAVYKATVAVVVNHVLKCVCGGNCVAQFERSPKECGLSLL